MPKGIGRPSDPKMRELTEYANKHKKRLEGSGMRENLVETGRLMDANRAASADFERGMSDKIRGGTKVGKPGQPYAFKKGGMVKGGQCRDYGK